MKTITFLFLSLFIFIYPIRAVYLEESSVFEMEYLMDNTIQEQGFSDEYIAQSSDKNQEERHLQPNIEEGKPNTVNRLLISQICMYVAIIEDSDNQLNFMRNMFIEYSKFH